MDYNLTFMLYQISKQRKSACFNQTEPITILSHFYDWLGVVLVKSWSNLSE